MKCKECEYIVLMQDICDSVQFHWPDIKNKHCIADELKPMLREYNKKRWGNKGNRELDFRFAKCNHKVR